MRFFKRSISFVILCLGFYSPFATADTSLNIETAGADILFQAWCDQPETFSDFNIDNACERHVENISRQPAVANDFFGLMISQIKSGAWHFVEVVGLNRAFSKLGLKKEASPTTSNSLLDEQSKLDNFSIALDAGIEETLVKFTYKF